jgi:hypothetical protein
MSHKSDTRMLALASSGQANPKLTKTPHTLRVKWHLGAYQGLCEQLPLGEAWWSLTCRDDPDYEIYLFVHEEDMVRFKLTWM